MDAQYNIYQAEDVPPEDKARLDGYLRARTEADAEAHARLVEEYEALRAQVEGQ